MKHVIEAIVDEERFSRSRPRSAQNIVCGFARARRARGQRRRHQPRARRRARHRRRRQGRTFRAHLRRVQRTSRHLRRRARLPPGTAQEWGGIIRHRASSSYAYAEATVPKLTVITRRRTGRLRRDAARSTFARRLRRRLAHGEVAAMGPDGAVNIVFRSELQRPAIRTRAGTTSWATTRSASPTRMRPPSAGKWTT